MLRSAPSHKRSNAKEVGSDGVLGNLPSLPLQLLLVSIRIGNRHKRLESVTFPFGGLINLMRDAELPTLTVTVADQARIYGT